MKKKNRDGKKSKFSLVQRYKIKSNIIKKFKIFQSLCRIEKRRRKRILLVKHVRNVN